VRVTNTGSISATITNLVLSATGSGNDQAGISGVQVYLDINGNGILDGDTFLGTATYSSNDGNISLALTVPCLPVPS